MREAKAAGVVSCPHSRLSLCKRHIRGDGKMFTRTRVLGLAIASLLALTLVCGPATAPPLPVKGLGPPMSSLARGPGVGTRTAGDPENVELVGHIGGITNAYALALQGSYAYAYAAAGGRRLITTAQAWATR